jgi:hypothetical protein
MSSPPRAPGWYRDPLDRTRIRHWSGLYWDVPQRRLPPWALGTAAVVVSPRHLGQGEGPRLDGPVDLAALPVKARSSARVRAARLGRPLPPGPSHGGPGGIGPSAGVHGPARPALSRRRQMRTPFTVSSVLVVAALLVVAGFISFSKSPSTVTQVSSDSAYVTAANTACTSSLGALTAADETATATPAEVASSNKVISALMTKLQTLPSAAAVAGQTSGWFASWSAYKVDRTREASYLASHPEHSAPAQHEEAALAGETRTAAADADSFAQANSLGDCVLASPTGKGTARF